MAQPFSKWFYNSKKWQACRASYIAQRRQRDGGMCEMCRQNIGVDVDHIKDITLYNINDSSVTLNHNNLQLLCKRCHNIKTHSNQSRNRVTFDEDGNILYIKDIEP